MRHLVGALALLAGTMPAVAQTDLPPLPVVEREIRAQVTARTGAALASPMAGRIEHLAVEDGDRFKNGAVLVRFDCDLQEGQLARARAVLEKRRRVAEVNDRLQKLGSVSTKEVAVGHAEVQEAQADVAIARALVDRCTITAPFPGRVAGLAVRAHQFIGEGQPLMEILDDRELELETIVPSRWLAWLEPGTRFKVALDETGRTYEAVVARLFGKVDPVSQSIKLYGRIPAHPDELLPGMSGRALFDLPEGGGP